jgi:hypothetical protein
VNTKHTWTTDEIGRLLNERDDLLAALRVAREALDTDALNDSVNKLQTDAFDAVCAAIAKVEST